MVLSLRAPMVASPGRVKREVLVLVTLVVLVEAGFACLAVLGGLRQRSPALKLGFTVLWTLATLLIVIRGLTRIRAARLRQ